MTPTRDEVFDKVKEYARVSCSPKADHRKVIQSIYEMMRKSRKYISLVQFTSLGYPTCELHGAMLCMNSDKTLWRCPDCNVGIDVSGMISNASIV
jgi:hypothetical protein